MPATADTSPENLARVLRTCAEIIERHYHSGFTSEECRALADALERQATAPI